MAADVLLPLVAAIVGLGVLSQVLGSRFQVPSIIFLILAGLLLGPVSGFVLGEPLVDPNTFGDALPAIVGLSVAIIVFEGAYNLRASKLREAPRETIRLVTVGAVIALVGTAVAVRFALGQPWPLSFLIGALLVATGPTVITPILQVVPVRDRVAAALETEGIVNDVTAAIAAVVVFEVVLRSELEPVTLLVDFVRRLGIGLLVGVVVAGTLYYLIRHVDLSPGDAPRNARLLVLAGAVVAYGAASTIAGESGIAAVAVAGILLGNADLPHDHDIEAFKGDVTLLVLSFVFIALAALLRPSDIVELGPPGLLVVVAVALFVRPALVFLSMAGDRFTTNEKLFVSLVGPRGIIPASVATLFAVELQSEQPEAATALVGTVFLVILVTVAVEGGLARTIAEHLDVIPMRVIVVGAGRVGMALASRLEDRGENVVLVEMDEEQVEIARNAGHIVHIGDGADIEVLRNAGMGNARIAVAATGDDDVNLLIAQLADSNFDVETVLARVNNPGNVEAFRDLGVRVISPTDATAQALDNLIERPALADWTSNIGDVGDVQEVEVTANELVGRTVRDVGPDLPSSVLIALVARDGEVEVPDAGYELRRGDRITLIGSRDAVRDAMEFCHPG